MWTREAISASTERRWRRWVMRHNQPSKVLLTSGLLTFQDNPPENARPEQSIGFDFWTTFERPKTAGHSPVGFIRLLGDIREFMLDESLGNSSLKTI